MTLFRLTRLKYAGKLTGYGASLYGNRWNSKGVEMVYTAESRSLAMAEVMVHLTLASLPSDFMMVEIEVPNEVTYAVLKPFELNKNWNANPFVSSTQKTGDAFIHSGKSCLLKVPSAVVQGDSNYLINPYHIQFKLIKIAASSNFPFDHRIFKT